MGMLLVINGYSGSGKSTVARMFAEKHKYALIVQDYFLFNMNAANLKEPSSAPGDHEIAFINNLQVVENYMKIKRNVVLEGALVSISKQDPLDLRDYIKLAKKHSYDTKVITLVAKGKTRTRRQKKRKCVVPRHIDKTLREATHDINELIGTNTTLDTTKLSRKKMLEALEELVA